MKKETQISFQLSAVRELGKPAWGRNRLTVCHGEANRAVARRQSGGKYFVNKHKNRLTFFTFRCIIVECISIGCIRLFCALFEKKRRSFRAERTRRGRAWCRVRLKTGARSGRRRAGIHRAGLFARAVENAVAIFLKYALAADFRLIIERSEFL